MSNKFSFNAEDIFKEYPDVVGVDDVCNMLGISRAIVYKLIREGKLQTIPSIKRHRILKIKVIELLLN